MPRKKITAEEMKINQEVGERIKNIENSVN